MPPQAHNPASATRISWVDCFKGLCIVLVVFGHVVGGLSAAGVVPDGSLLNVLRSWVYLFHMPAFFFASGLFARKAATRPLLVFLRSRLSALVYPYCLWTGIVLVSQFALARFANHPPEFSKALRFPFEPYGYGLWFLYALLLISMLYQGAARLRVPPLFITAGALVLYAAASRNWFQFWPIVNTSLGYFIYFALGALLAGSVFLDTVRWNWHTTASVAAGTFGAMTLLNWLLPGFTWGLPLLLALLGITGLLALAKGIAALGIERFWSYLGAHSLEIYLGHILLATLPRPLLKAAGVSEPWPYVACGVATGVFGSLAVMVLCEKLGCRHLYSWPQRA